MALTTAIPCPRGCEVDVLLLKKSGSPLPFIVVTAAPNPTGHVVETSADNGRTLKKDQSDAGGATIYQAHNITCSAG